ncbi:hypothetical protein M8332_07150 (plasmid) [Fructilactobacillus ixorae]|uniref:Uncharacterized protein n=1 Tax=Fructilactobacillus ixorae TaxID=1750535 RepID=A0ABY5C6I2_9LACO|nr:hypothetical protein [Fructilactobacillus ixorae]USS93992.1 hypothetical protein M8332_07150 [Fructilactobacillus ixorae]
MSWEITLGDVVQSLASILGAVLGILGIWWQINKQSREDIKNQINFKKFDDYFSLASKVNKVMLKVPNRLETIVEDNNKFIYDPFYKLVKNLEYEVKNRFEFLNTSYGIENSCEIDSLLESLDDKLNEFSKLSDETKIKSIFKNGNNFTVEYDSDYIDELWNSRESLIKSIKHLSNFILNNGK